MNCIKNWRDRWLASDNLFRQILGAVVRWWPITLLLILSVVPLLLSIANWNDWFVTASKIIRSSWYWLLCLTFFVMLVILVCHTLTNIFNLRKRENGITWCQISILFAVVVWILGFIVIFNVQGQPRYNIILGIAGTLLGWIFQDTLKGVVAFIHLRLFHLLCIDDWIQVPKYNADGLVKRVTLTTVTIYNWDTTISSIPTSALHLDHFVNLQNMLVGKTYGRQMLKSFLLDTNWVHPLSAEEIALLKKQLVSHDGQIYLLDEDFKEGVLNAQLYRLYLYHWLMNNPHISQMPRLMVRWLDTVKEGMTLQIYAFITDSGIMGFEWQQSQIIEHVVASLEWFGLSLYQSASSYDVSNVNVHLNEKVANYRKELCNE